MKIVIFTFFLLPTMSHACEVSSDFSNIKISSAQIENGDIFNNIILDGCDINKYWKYKSTISEKSNRLFIDSTINRLLLRFEYLFQKVKVSNSIQISIDSFVSKGIGKSSVTISKFDITQSEIIDAFITLDCINNTNNYFTVRTKISLYNNYTNKSFDFEIEMIKLCNCAIKDSLDISHFILLIIIAGIILASVHSYFTSKFEETILKKYPEIRNPENLSIIAVIIAIVFWFFYITDILSIWINITIIFVITISVGMIFEAILKSFHIKAQLSNRTLEIDFLGSITMYFLLCLTLGLISFLLWNCTNNWIIGDFIAVAITIETIRIFKFTSFKFILTLSFAIWIYDWYRVLTKDIFYNEHSRLINQFPHFFPIHITFPQMRYTIIREFIPVPISNVIIPGILINYFYRFDKNTNPYYHYFKISSVGYLIGLLIKFIIFSYWHLFFPSLFIVIPFTIIPPLILSYKREEIAQMFEGFKSNVFAEKEPINIKQETVPSLEADSNNNKLEMKLVG